jgi:ADP-heptose:LPS heptosyltransferase
MKSSLMQLIDNYLGRFLCFTLSLIKRKKRDLPPSVKNILIIKMFGMGSIILTTPMISLLRANHPGCRIHFLTFQSNREIIELYDVADEIHTVNKDSHIPFLKDMVGVFFTILGKKFDVVIDAEFFSRMTALFSYLVCARYNVGFFNYGIYRGDFLDRRCYFNAYRHITENFLELGRAISTTMIKTGTGRPLRDETKDAAALQHLKECGVKLEEKIIIFNPNISDLSPWIDRRWPLERFTVLGKFLLERGYRLVVIGGKGDVEPSERVASSIDASVHSLAGKLSLYELITLFSRSFLLITNDSGPLHIAASVDLPTFAFFGTDTPVIYGYDSPLHTIFFKGIACSPCLSVYNFKRGKCDQNIECIKSITVEEVIGEFLKKEAFLNEVTEKNRNSKRLPEPEPEKA